MTKTEQALLIQTDLFCALTHTLISYDKLCSNQILLGIKEALLIVMLRYSVTPDSSSKLGHPLNRGDSPF